MSSFADTVARFQSAFRVSPFRTALLVRGDGAAAEVSGVPGQVQPGAAAVDAGMELSDSCVFEVDSAEVLAALGRLPQRGDAITCVEVGYEGTWTVGLVEADAGFARCTCVRSDLRAAGKRREVV